MTAAIDLARGTAAADDERRELLERLGATPASRLLVVEGTPSLDLPEAAYDAILCVDGIARVADRIATLSAWARALAPAGRVLYTDPAIIAGLVTSAEIGIRGGEGLFVVSPQGENESSIEAAGLRLLRADDATDAYVAGADAHAERGVRDAFVATARELAASRRLARIAFLAEKPS